MCKYFIEIVNAANFGQNPYKLSFAIQYRETSHSPSPPVESSYVQISPSQYTAITIVRMRPPLTTFNTLNSNKIYRKEDTP